jgi:hypothetical protein
MNTLAGDEPELQLGDTGEHVTQLQDRLRGLQLLNKFPDGAYDDETETAVRQLQSNLGHQGDGKVTQDTWQALDQHMVDQGLHYNPAAGAANQHWDTGMPGGADQQTQAGGAEQGAHQPAAADQGGQQPEPYWDGQQWLHYDSASGQWVPTQNDAAPAAASGATQGADAGGHNQTQAEAGAAQQPEPYWDGQQWLHYDSTSGQWVPMQNDAAPADAGGGHSAAQAAGAAPAAPEPPVVPHIDNVHPGVRDDERFSSFHDFLRETHGS